MTTYPDSIIVTGPQFQEVSAGTVVVTPTSGSQVALQDALGPAAEASVGSGTTGPVFWPSIAVGSVAYASVGNATTTVAGTIYWSEIYVTRNFTATGVAVLNAGTVGTDKGLVGLYSSAGVLLANSATAGATTSGANAFQSYNFTGTIALLGPARYWIAYQSNGTTDNFRTVAASTFLLLTKSATGAFGTLTALAPPTTFTANVGPIGYVY